MTIFLIVLYTVDLIVPGFFVYKAIAIHKKMKEAEQRLLEEHIFLAHRLNDYYRRRKELNDEQTQSARGIRPDISLQHQANTQDGSYTNGTRDEYTRKRGSPPYLRALPGRRGEEGYLPPGTSGRI